MTVNDWTTHKGEDVPCVKMANPRSYITFGKKLRQLRELAGLTQRQLALRINKDPMSVSRYETGQQSAPLSQRIEIAHALGVPPEAFQKKHYDLTLPHPVRHEEPLVHPEVQAVQEKMLAKFGRHEGPKQKRTLPGSDLTKYGMEPCWSCGKITAIDMTCLDCGAERPYQLPVA